VPDIRRLKLFIRYPRSILYDIAQKYTNVKKSEEDSANPTKELFKKKDCKDPSCHPKLKSSFRKTQGCRFGKGVYWGLLYWGWVMTIFESSKRICTFYVLQIWQMLSENIKAKRVVRCNLLLYLLKHEAAGRLRFFSDKIFYCWCKSAGGTTVDSLIIPRLSP